MQRINWIDWVKAFCMTVVVFCHLPQQEDTFYLQYLASVILSSFFFVSGYLKKPLPSQKEALKKYSHSLLIPYLIYNILYYPYWFAKLFIEHGGVVTFEDCMKPIIGTSLGQLDSSFSCELNGVTWFLITLFLMHWVTDICNRQKHGKALMLIISIICIILYGANKYYHYAPYLTYHGFVRCICFFFMGNYFRQKNIISEKNVRKNITIGFFTLITSLFLFYWHIHEDRFVLHIILYYVVNLFSVYGFIYYFCSINNIKSHLVTAISIGTLIIFGLHRIIIGIIDFGLEKVFHLSNISYNWYEGGFITICTILVFLPFIHYAQRHNPILLGKK